MTKLFSSLRQRFQLLIQQRAQPTGAERRHGDIFTVAFWQQKLTQARRYPLGSFLVSGCRGLSHDAPNVLGLFDRHAFRRLAAFRQPHLLDESSGLAGIAGVIQRHGHSVSQQRPDADHRQIKSSFPTDAHPAGGRVGVHGLARSLSD